MSLFTMIFLFYLTICSIIVLSSGESHTHSLAFNSYDLDQTGFIDSNEFNLLVKDLFDNQPIKNPPSHRLMPSQSKKLFEMLDLTSDGLIDKVEFAKIWDHWVQPLLNPKSILLVFDMQNDYLMPDGSMYMKGANSIVNNINSLIKQEHFSNIFYVRDYHPANHCSFNYSANPINWNQDSNSISLSDDEQYSEEATYDCQIRTDYEQALWPRHCVQGSNGAKFYSDLVIKPHNDLVKFINKGTDPRVDSYSAFFDNDGNSLLLLKELNRLDSKKKNWYKLKTLILCFSIVGKIVTIYVVGVMLEYEIINTALDSVSLGYPTVVLHDAVWSKDPQYDDLVYESLQKANVILAGSQDVYSIINGRDRRLEAGFVLANRLYQKYNSRFY